MGMHSLTYDNCYLRYGTLWKTNIAIESDHL